MRARLEKDCRPFRVKASRYNPEQRAFVEKYTDKLVEMGVFVETPTAAWQATHFWPKSGSKSIYCMAIDLGPVNSATVKETWPMPYIDSEVADFAGSSCFAVLDFISAYWQLALDPESFIACGIVVRKKVLTSKRVLPELANATSYFQSSIEPLFKERREHMISRLDDFSLHTPTEAELLKVLEKVFRI